MDTDKCIDKIAQSRYQEQVAQNIPAEMEQSWADVIREIKETAYYVYLARVEAGKAGDSMQDWWRATFQVMQREATKHIEISDICYDPSKSDEISDEYIEITNRGILSIDLSGWKINAGNKGQDFTFPANTVLAPGKCERILTKKDEKRPWYLSFLKSQAIWNNKGDLGILYDNENRLISSFAYGCKATSFVTIRDLCFDGVVKHVESDEYIELINHGDHIVDISGWRINAGKDQDFRFPEKSKLHPQQTCRVYTNEIHKSSGGYSFKSPQAIWNNKGDIATLYDAHDNRIASWAYGNKASDCVVISDLCYDGIVKGVESDEFIELTNNSKELIADISGWKINAGKNQDFLFPPKSKLKPGQSCRVYTNEVHEETGGYTFGSDQAIWNNKGDIATLYDNKEKVVFGWAYGNKK